jgi:CysZ protein
LGVPTRVDTATRPAKQFMTGLGLLGRGLALYGRNPGMILLGILPALITFVVLVGSFVLLVYFINDIATAVTWFASDWSSGARDLIRVLAGVAIVGVAALVFIVGYTAITLAVGEPFYEKIAEKVDDRYGGLPNAVELPWHRELLRGLGESVRLIAFSVVMGVGLFLAGLLPAVGQTVVPVIGAIIGGWALSVELTGVAFARRGMRLKQRRKVLRRHRPLAIGFGVGVFLCFLIPLGAVIIMPAAVAGATLLTRNTLGEPISLGTRPVPAPPAIRSAR